jgi:hypothetical protein
VPTTDSKPKSIQSAVLSLRISAGLAFALTLLQLAGAFPLAGANLSAAAITGVVTVGLLILVAEKIGAGRNWARWLFVVVYALGSLLFVLILLVEPQVFLALPTISKVSGTVQFAIQTGALICVFSPGSRSWFERGAATS